MSGLQRTGVGTVDSYAGNRAQSFGGRMLNKGMNLIKGTLSTGMRVTEAAASLAAAVLIVDGSRQAVTSFARKNPNDELVKILPSFVLKDGKKEAEFAHGIATSTANFVGRISDSVSAYFSKHEMGCQMSGDAFVCPQYVKPTYGQSARIVAKDIYTSASVSQHAETARQTFAGFSGAVQDFASDKFISVSQFFGKNTSAAPVKPTLEETPAVCTSIYSEYVASAKALVDHVATAVSAKASDVKDSVVNALSATNVSSDEFMENSMKLAAVGLAVGVAIFAAKKYRELGSAKSENKELASQNAEFAYGKRDLIAENKFLTDRLNTPAPKIKNVSLRRARGKIKDLEDIAQRQQAFIKRLVEAQTGFRI